MDREEFAKRLNSVIVPEGMTKPEMDSMLAPVSEAIRQMMPPCLFRCRKCDVNSIVAFKNDIIYAVTPDVFNDPYDTVFMYDLETIEHGINDFLNIDSVEQLQKWIVQGNDFPEGMRQLLPADMIIALKEKLLSLKDLKEYAPRIEEVKHAMISWIRQLFPLLAEESQKYCRVACFSESINSILMWSHYADSHRGFALEYDFRNVLVNPIKNVLVAPVVYEEKRLDVSSYLAWEFLHLLKVNSKNPDTSSHIKSVLHKSSAWAYEKEWRLVDYTLYESTDSGASAIPYKPTAIYYGARMDPGQKGLLHDIAKEKGIREYDMFLDYSSPEYEVKCRQVGING